VLPAPLFNSDAPGPDYPAAKAESLAMAPSGARMGCCGERAVDITYTCSWP
jgi:hypothetical protein